MKKITFVICAILMVLMVSPVQAAAHQPTGDQINIYDSGAQEYPANTAFYIQHGWLILKPNSIGWLAFELEVDGALIPATYIDHSGTTMDTYNHSWVFSFPDGMTGVHTFSGHWYLQCNAALRFGFVTECSHPTAHVDLQSSEVVVTFTP